MFVTNLFSSIDIIQKKNDLKGGNKIGDRCKYED